MLFVSDSGSETALVRLREPMNVLADTNVAWRRRTLDAGFTEFFLNGKVEIAPATSAAGTLLDRRILQNRPNQKLSETAHSSCRSARYFLLFMAAYFLCLFI